MDLQAKERQATTAAAATQNATQDKAAGNSALRGMTFEEGQQKLAPPAEAGAPAPAAAAPKVDDDGGPGAVVIRNERPDPRYGKPPAAVKVAVKDQQVDENQTASVKAEVVDPEAPGKTNQLWFEWGHTGGPAWQKPAGLYNQDMSFQAPEVEKDDVLTGEVSVSKRGHMLPRGVTTKKPFSVKVREVAKPEKKEEVAPAAPPAAQAQTPLEKEPGKPAAPDMSVVEALLAQIAAGQNKKKDETPPAQTQPPAPVKTEEPRAAEPVKKSEPAAPAVQTEPAAPVHHHHHHHHHHRRRPHHRHHYMHRHHRRHAGHGHRKHHHHGHRPAGPAPGMGMDMMAMMLQMMKSMAALMTMHKQPHMPAPGKPPIVPPFHPPAWMPPKQPPKVTAPADKTLQAGERGILKTTVLDPDQGKSLPPRIEWTQQPGGPRVENIVGQGTSQVEFTAPQVSQKATLGGIVKATDAQGLSTQAAFKVIVEPKVAAGETGKAWGDPHFVGGDGGTFDVMGRDGGVYNLLSDAGVRVTGMFKTYNREGITIIDRVGAIVTGKGPKGVTSNNIEFVKGVGTLDGKAIPKGKPTALADGGSALQLGDRLIIDTREGYKVTIWTRKSGAIDYCDVDVQTGARGVGSGEEPGGLIGQTFDADKAAKNGKKGMNAQGEGAIAGVVTDYETKGLFGAATGKLAGGIPGAAADEQRLVRKTVLVAANPGLGAEGFIETGIDVAPGDTVLISATGAAGEARSLNRNPAGDPRYSHPQKANFMSASAPAFALVGRVTGEKDGFMVGANFKGGVQKAGKLQLAFNDLRGTFADNVGEYLADVQVVKGVA